MSEKEAIQRQIEQLRAGKTVEQVPPAAADDQDVEQQAATVGASTSKEQLQQQIEELRAGKAAAGDVADTERQSLTSLPVSGTDSEDQPSLVLMWTAKMAAIDEVAAP